MDYTMKENRNQASKEINKIIRQTERELLLNEDLNALLSEMKENKFKGTYKITDKRLLNGIYQKQ